MEKKSPHIPVPFRTRADSLVKSPVESCAMHFPQAVDSQNGRSPVLHRFLHKLSLSTPQSFKISTAVKSLHFSEKFPRRLCAEDLSQTPRKMGISTVSSSLLRLLSFYLFVLLCFAASLHSHKVWSGLSSLDGQNEVVRPGRTKKENSTDYR